jgi:hypothetical protein
MVEQLFVKSNDKYAFKLLAYCFVLSTKKSDYNNISGTVLCSNLGRSYIHHDGIIRVMELRSTEVGTFLIARYSYQAPSIDWIRGYYLQGGGGQTDKYDDTISLIS